MGQALGAKSRLSVGEEATYKTDATSAQILYFVSETLNQERPNVDSNVIRGDRNPEEPVRGNSNVSGSISTELQAYIGSLYKGALGSSLSATHTRGYVVVSGVMVEGETVTGSISGETAILVYNNPSGPIYWFTSVSGTFQSETLTGSTSGATATIGADFNVISAAPYVHRITVGDSVPSFTMEKGFLDLDTPEYFKFNGCKINSMSVSATTDGMQEVSFDVIGASQALSATPEYAAPTDLGKASFDSLSMVAADMQEGGTASTVVTSIDLSVSNNLDDTIYVLGGNGQRKYLPEGLVMVTGTLNAVFEDVALYTKALNSTESSLRVKWRLGTGTEGTAGNEAIAIDLPELVYSPNTPTIEGPTGIQVSLPFTAYYQNSDYSTAMSITIWNTQTSI